MNTAPQIYQFEGRTVRVVSIAGEPWFVATDLAKALGYSHTPHMRRALQEDEKGVHIMDPLYTGNTPAGGNQEMNVISESGMYAAIFKSRKVEAERFRKWVTSEVLPSIRKTGKYELAGYTPPVPTEISCDIDVPSVSVALNMIREARRLFGNGHAREVWMRLGLPEPIAEAAATIEQDAVLPIVKAYIADKERVTLTDVVHAIGLDPDSLPDRRRVTEALKFCGRTNRVHRVAGHNTRVWVRLSTVEG